MTLQSLATKLAEAPELASSGLQRMTRPLRPARRGWTVAEAAAAFGLGIVVGVALALLLHGPAEPEEEIEPDS
jgi:hypothetical protein